MKTVLKFSIKELQAIAKEIHEADFFIPSFEEMYDAKIHKDGVIRDEDGRAEDHPDFRFPHRSNLDFSKVEPAIHLVKDHGIYLMSNAAFNDDKKRSVAVYAKGFNPETDDYWYELARDFSSDDCVISLPFSWLEAALVSGKRIFTLVATEDRIAVI